VLEHFGRIIRPIGQNGLAIFTRTTYNLFLFTNDKGRLAPLTCNRVHQTLKSFSTSINTKARK